MTKVRDREQVIEAAARVFAGKGYEAARLEDIAAELGILKGSLYYHVSSKAELYFLVNCKRAACLIAGIEQIAAGSATPAEKLATALRAHLHHLDRYYPESSHWFLNPATSPSTAQQQAEYRRLSRAYEAALRGLVEEGITAGELRPDLDPKVATLGLLGMCNWLARWYHQDGRLSIDAIAGTLIAMALDGLRCSGRLPPNE